MTQIANGVPRSSWNQSSNTRKQVPSVFKTDRKCSNPRCPVFRKATTLLVCRRCHRATAVSVYRPHTP